MTTEKWMALFCYGWMVAVVVIYLILRVPLTYLS